MAPVKAIRSCLRQYAGFSGRAPRSEFWWWLLCAGLVLVFGSIALLGMGADDLDVDPEVGSGSIAATILWVGVLIPTLALTVRRLHDTDWSGWWALSTALCNAAPVYGAAFGLYALGVALGIDAVLLTYMAVSAVSLVVFVRMFFPGSRGDNRFGPDPLSGLETR